MKIINQSKLNRQLEVISRWWSVSGRGVWQAVTGFGKTYVILLIIKRMTDKFPNYRSTIIVPSTQLKLDWERQIEEMNLPNVIVYVVNTYVKFTDGDSRLDTDLIAGDEAHHYASEEAQFFNQVLKITKYKYCIFASATLEADEIAFLRQHGIFLFDTITTEEAEVNGWIAPSIIYNLKIPFSDKDRELSAKLDRTFKGNFAKFDHNFSLMMACSGGKKRLRVQWHGEFYWKTGLEWRAWWASNMGWEQSLGDEHAWSPNMIIRYAMLGTKSMKERKEFLYNMPSKIDVVLQLLDKFPDKKIIVFCESQLAADALEHARPNVIKAYHSNLSTILIDGKKFGVARRRKLIIEEFESSNSCRVIACVKALDEGFNVESVEVGIMHSYVSKKRRDVQRRGRPGRIDYDNLGKIALNINLYMEDSQELKWLKAKQKGSKKAIWVDSVSDINLGG